MRWPSIDRHAWTTLRSRLTLWNTAVVLLMTIAALLAVRIGARSALTREADAVLRGTVREVAIAITDLYPDIDAVVAEMRRKAAGHAERGWFTQLLTGDGETIWKSELCPDEVAAYPPTAADRRENIVQVGPYRYVRLAIEGPDRRPFHVRIGMSTAYLDENVAALMRLLIPVGVALSLLTPLAGYWLAVRATRPVADILRTADRLRPTRLGDRLTVSGSKDELDRLSLTINRLLDEVAGHVERQEQFVADAAHELRGPLAAMQSTLEVAVSQDRSSDEYRDTLEDVLDAARHLSKIANDLLLLAESSEASAPRAAEPVSLATVADQAVGMFVGAAEEQEITLRLEVAAEPIVASDASRVRQVIGNLLDNALRFTPRGGTVTVRVAAGAGDDGILTVTDDGPGIAPCDLDRVFDRFFKVDLARTRSAGHRSGGLGLAICKSFVEASQGSITIASSPKQGTRVTVRLPAWRDTARRLPTPADHTGNVPGSRR
ncbi:MAG: Signal transduction histidine-protein kinase BaeS [Planctomycetota bacterium]|jgi:signal transduction histidine kinase